MELWIRSQDKERLTTINDLRIYYALVEKVWVIADCDDLGYYKTKERALEVLDEIQDILEKNQPSIISYANGDIVNVNGNYVYEMPKE